jgi:hypothetical protein
MSANASRSKTPRKVTLRAVTEEDVIAWNSPINAFTLIRECATNLALATRRYRRSRYLLTAARMESAFVEGTPVDPEFTKQRKAYSDAAREMRAQLSFLAASVPEHAGGVLRGLTNALGHDASAEQFENISEVFGAWSVCERLLDFGDSIGPIQTDFTIPSDAKLDAINANLAILLALFRDNMECLGFTIPR